MNTRKNICDSKKTFLYKFIFLNIKRIQHSDLKLMIICYSKIIYLLENSKLSPVVF